MIFIYGAIFVYDLIKTTYKINEFEVKLVLKFSDNEDVQTNFYSKDLAVLSFRFHFIIYCYYYKSLSILFLF